ncbi:MAG: sialate O-acetylesterase, partial [Verrucomicrobia bacterium]|nr:sialate O-acetylesterase [Verrucomicrobiota bacterium]
MNRTSTRSVSLVTLGRYYVENPTPHPGPLPASAGRGRDSRAAINGRRLVNAPRRQHSLSPSDGERVRVRGQRSSTAWLRLSLATAFLALAPPAQAAVTLSAVFSDHMVLQRDMALPVWGWAEPGEEVTVEFAGQKKTARADAKGKWMVKLDPMPASAEPRNVRISSTLNPQPLTISAVLVGEVWLCSGQSNMAMTVNRAKDFEKEQPAAKLPNIRVFTERSGPAEKPQEKCSGTWAVCSPETVGAFSATAYFFGRKLHQELNVPVGLLNSSVGGTPIEAWTSREVMAGKAEFKPLFEKWEKMQAAWDPVKANAQYDKQLAAWKEAAKKAKAAGKTVPRAPRKPEEP